MSQPAIRLDVRNPACDTMVTIEPDFCALMCGAASWQQLTRGGVVSTEQKILVCRGS